MFSKTMMHLQLSGLLFWLGVTWAFANPFFAQLETSIANNEIFYAKSHAQDGYHPNMGNGFISGNVGCYRNSTFPNFDLSTQLGHSPCGVFYNSGVFNGNLSHLNNGVYANASHRAAIPGI